MLFGYIDGLIAHACTSVFTFPTKFIQNNFHLLSSIVSMTLSPIFLYVGVQTNTGFNYHMIHVKTRH